MVFAPFLATIASTVCAQPPSPRPLLGVIRWDMYSGNSEITQKQEFGFLKPEEYWWRAPFFVRRTGDWEHPLPLGSRYGPHVSQWGVRQRRCGVGCSASTSRGLPLTAFGS
ncbi:MAG: hypothetical protein FJX75_25750 [Armatimonadetes bacterium]|nr:hypothetical protein [Armatimonadota bacterium]